MSGKHTPGPWRWRGANEPWQEIEQEFRGLDGPDKEDVLRVEDTYRGYPECGEELRIFADAANARLIAAAPELLEACKAYLSDPDGSHAASLALAAIAKAERS